MRKGNPYATGIKKKESKAQRPMGGRVDSPSGELGFNVLRWEENGLRILGVASAETEVPA